MHRILSLLFLLMAIKLNAQIQINGFGRLKLGSSTSAIPELNKAVKMDLTQTDNNFVYGNVLNLVYEIVCDTNLDNPFGTYDTRVREFQIGQFQLTENIKVQDVRLKYFNDQLYEIGIYDPQIKELLTSKYGPGLTSIWTDERTLQNVFGAKFNRTDSVYNTKWKTINPQLECYSNKIVHYGLEPFPNSILTASEIMGINKYIRDYSVLLDLSHQKEIETQSQVIKDRIEKRKEEAVKKRVDTDGF